jgi:DNA-binding CsgD family transcriptional regulator
MGGGDGNADIMRRILESERISDVLDTMYLSCAELGADKFSYHPEVMFESVASAKSDVYSRGYPAEWREIYLQGGARQVDPVPDFVMQLGKPITFRDLYPLLHLTPSARDYLRTVRKMGVLSGVGFPLWGPQGQNAFVAVGFADPDFAWSRTTIAACHMVLLAGHQKIVELLPTSGPTPALSSREVEVLTWIGRGKSNTDVGAILSIAPETVATYTRRIFTKLDCHDRIGAVIKGLRLGLIRL